MRAFFIFLCIALVQLAYGQFTYKQYEFNYPHGGALSWTEVDHAPNERIKKVLMEGVSDLMLQNYSLEDSPSSLDELKKHATDTVNPFVGIDETCPDCENSRALFISEYDNLATINYTESYFCCGAHDSYASVMKSYDIKMGKPVQLSDIFMAKAEAIFKKEIEKQIRKAYDIPPKQNLADYGYHGFGEGIVLAENWLIENGEIRFVYNPYEVGPWALPPPYVEISLNKVKPYIKRDGPLAGFLSKPKK